MRRSSGVEQLASCGVALYEKSMNGSDTFLGVTLGSANDLVCGSALAPVRDTSPSIAAALDISGDTKVSESILASRKFFPRGMLQPLGAFRFSRDALLLADFAARLAPAAHKGQSVADMGAGCGVVGLAYLLHRATQSSFIHMVGLEQNDELCVAARQNAARLGFDSSSCASYTVVKGDVADEATLQSARRCLDLPDSPTWPPLFDAVLCNPPWRREGCGRVPLQPARRAALFGTPETLVLFFHAADTILRQHGSLFTIAGADRLADAIAALPPRLKPVRVRLVHSSPNAGAVFFIMQAIKGSGAALILEPPLFLNKTEIRSIR